MASNDKTTPRAVRKQLERILGSPEFKATDKQKEFLSFVVGETLEDRASRLKGYTIAVDVYGRTENFDPQVDPVVRLEAGRLRRALDHYYLKAGRNDPVRIEIPKGGYIPTFQSVKMPLSGDQAQASEIRDDAPPTEPSIAVMPLINLSGDPDCYRRGDYEKAYSEALKFNFPDLYLDPMMRATALGQLARQKEAKKAIEQLLKMEPNFRHRAHRMIGRYIKVDDLIDKIIVGLQKAGLGDLE